MSSEPPLPPLANSQVLLRVDPRRGGVVFRQSGQPTGEALWTRELDGESRLTAPEDDERLPLGRALPELRRHADVRVLAYRPERRLVLRVDDGQAARVLKGYRRKQLETAFTRHEWAAGVLSDGPLRAPPSPELDESLCALRWPALSGRALDLHPSGSAMLFRLGAGLAQFQQGTPWPDAQQHDVRSEVAVTDRMAELMGRAEMALPAGWRSVRQGLVPGPEHAGVSLVPTHRDLHDGQLLVTPDGLVLLDYDLLCLADPVLDLANLIAHLRLRELQGHAGATDASVDQCGRELLDGFGAEATHGLRRRLRFYQASSFLRLALVYALRPPWRHLSRELVAVGEHCLHEV